jgi:hypothetical protein
MNRVFHISNSISVTNVISRVPLCSRVSVRVAGHSLVIRELTGVNDDDLYDINYVHVQDRGYSKGETVSMLLDLFSCSVKEVESMVRRYPELKFVSSKNAQCNIQFFKEKGVSEDVLYHNPWLLKYKAGDYNFYTSVMLEVDLD